MDKTLQRLLEAEVRAEQIAKQADEERERIIQGAIMEDRAEDQRFEARIPELHQSFIEKAELRAEQTISELKRRYDERHKQIREIAEEREADALNAAFSILIDPEVID